MSRSIAAALPEPLLAATIRWGSVGPLMLASAAIMGSPGPATISVAAAASAYGVGRSLAYLVGIVVGTMLVLVAVATGITATLLALPALRAVLIAISAAYITLARIPHRDRAAARGPDCNGSRTLARRGNISQRC